MLRSFFTKILCLFLFTAVFIASPGCSEPETLSSPEPSVAVPETEPTPEAEPAPVTDTPKVPVTSGEVISLLWEAMNSYDVELALSYYTDDYREAEREEVESDISRLRQFKVTLSLESISEPVPVAQGRVNHDVVLGTPIGDRHLVYELVEIDGDWKIYMETMPERLLEAREFIIGFLGEHDTSQRIDLSLNAKSHDIEPAVFEKVLVDLINAGEVVELEEGLYALAE